MYSVQFIVNKTSEKIFLMCWFQKFIWGLFVKLIFITFYFPSDPFSEGASSRYPNVFMFSTTFCYIKKTSSPLWGVLHVLIFYKYIQTSILNIEAFTVYCKDIVVKTDIKVSTRSTKFILRSHSGSICGVTYFSMGHF